MKKVYFIVFILGALLFNNSVYSATATFQHGVNGYTGGEDLEISSDNPNTNYISGGSNYSDRSGLRFCGSKCNKILLRFNSLGITGNITNVRLELKESGRQGGASNIYAYKISKNDWVNSQTTWNTYKTGSNWASAGGDIGSVLSIYNICTWDKQLG